MKKGILFIATILGSLQALAGGAGSWPDLPPSTHGYQCMVHANVDVYDFRLQQMSKDGEIHSCYDLIGHDTELDQCLTNYRNTSSLPGPVSYFVTLGFFAVPALDVVTNQDVQVHLPKIGQSLAGGRFSDGGDDYSLTLTVSPNRILTAVLTDNVTGVVKTQRGQKIDLDVNYNAEKTWASDRKDRYTYVPTRVSLSCSSTR